MPAPGLEPGRPFAAMLTSKGCKQAGEHGGDVAHPLESTRELSNGSLEELPQAGREAFKAKANDSQWNSACPTGPSHVPSGGTNIQRSGLCWQGGAASQSTLLPPKQGQESLDQASGGDGRGRQGASLYPFCRPAGKSCLEVVRRAGRKRGEGEGAEETDLLGLPGSLA